jgi:hypothetical protein
MRVTWQATSCICTRIEAPHIKENGKGRTIVQCLRFLTTLRYVFTVLITSEHQL